MKSPRNQTWLSFSSSSDQLHVPTTTTTNNNQEPTTLPNTATMAQNTSGSGTSTPSSEISRTGTPDNDGTASTSTPANHQAGNTTTNAAPQSPAPKNSHLLPQYNQHGNPVSALEREYPEVEGDLDIEEALRRKPIPHTFGHHVTHLKQATTGGAGGDHSEEEKRMREKKRELLGFQKELEGKFR